MAFGRFISVVSGILPSLKHSGTAHLMPPSPKSSTAPIQAEPQVWAVPVGDHIPVWSAENLVPASPVKVARGPGHPL